MWVTPCVCMCEHCLVSICICWVAACALVFIFCMWSTLLYKPSACSLVDHSQSQTLSLLLLHDSGLSAFCAWITFTHKIRLIRTEFDKLSHLVLTLYLKLTFLDAYSVGAHCTHFKMHILFPWHHSGKSVAYVYKSFRRLPCHFWSGARRRASKCIMKKSERHLTSTLMDVWWLWRNPPHSNMGFQQVIHR